MSRKDNNNNNNNNSSSSSYSRNTNWKIIDDDDDNNSDNIDEDQLKTYWNNEDTVELHKIDDDLKPTLPLPSIQSSHRKSFDEDDYSNNNIDNDGDDRPTLTTASMKNLKEMLGIADDHDNGRHQSLYTLVSTSIQSLLPYFKAKLLGSSPLFVPEYYDHYNILKQKKRYKLNILQRIFVMLEVPTASQIGSVISIIVFLVILLSCTVYVISTLPVLRYHPDTCDNPICQDTEYCPGEIVCEPVDPDWNNPIELACVVTFSIEYLLRMLLVGFVPPRLSDLIPSISTKFKLEHAMVNDEPSIFHFVKKNLQAGIAQRAEGMGECDSVDDEDEIHDVSSFSCNWYDQIEDDASVADQDASHFMQDIAMKLKNTTKTGTAKHDERVKERLDMKWYVKVISYGFTIMNLIDIAAILPFYIERFSESKASVSFIRILRLARVFRIFKMGKSSTGVRIIIKTMKKASAALAIVMFFIPLGIIFFGSLIYLFEGGTYTVDSEYPDGAYVRGGFWGVSEESPYTGIPASMYWAVVTSTTTGYGDLYPTSLWGRIVAMVCMYYGVLLMALPITVIGNNFNREYDKVHGNNDEKMTYECLSDLAKVTYDEAISKAQGLTPADTSSFKLTRLLLILTTFDLTKSDALKEGLTTTMKVRRKLDKEMRDHEAQEDAKSSSPNSDIPFKQAELLATLKNEIVTDREDLLRAIEMLQRSIKEEETNKK